MSNVSKPIDWDIFHIPSIEQVHYYSILKKKREFSQLIKQHDAQVFKSGYIHYCSIVPKSDSSCLDDKCELYILFFDDIPNTSFIGFRVKVSKETFSHESTLLLLFLKKSKKVIFYLMNNNYIHVKCRTSDAWELFYLLYYEYLKRYVCTVIGTQFFYSFTYCYFIEKEMQLLEMLYEGSKTVKISRKSIYYKIHKKRRISVTDLIYMIHNMPKNKKHAVSCFRFKKPPISYLKTKGIKSQTASGLKQALKFSEEKAYKRFQNIILDNESNFTFEKVDTSSNSFYEVCSESLVCKDVPCEFKKEVHRECFHLTSKRKFQEIESSACDSVPSSTCKLFKSSQPSLVKECKDHWEKYFEFKALAIKSYSDIPSLKKPVVSTLLKDNSDLFNDSSNTHLLNNCNVSNQSNLFLSAVSTMDSKEDVLFVKDIYDIDAEHMIEYNKNTIFPTTSVNRFSNTCILRMPHSIKTENGSNEYKTKFLPSTLERKIPADNSFCVESSGDNFYSVVPLVAVAENVNEDYIDSLGDVGFSTAAGKAISVSNAAMQTAHKIAKTVLSTNTEASNFNVHKRKAYNSIEDIGTLKKRKKEDIRKTTISEVQSYIVIGGSENQQVSKEIGIFSRNIGNFKEDQVNFKDYQSPEDVCFATAAGKNINVSETAMLAAQKIIKDAFTNEEQALDRKNDPGKCQNRRHKDLTSLKDLGCSSKGSTIEEMNDADMDRTFVEKFFEDTPFDEKDLELGQYNLNENSNQSLQLNKDTNLTSKTRKSLGGRRNMRFSEKQ